MCLLESVVLHPVILPWLREDYGVVVEIAPATGGFTCDTISPAAAPRKKITHGVWHGLSNEKTASPEGQQRQDFAGAPHRRAPQGNFVYNHVLKHGVWHIATKHCIRMRSPNMQEEPLHIPWLWLEHVHIPHIPWLWSTFCSKCPAQG
jgi:hypothetical protein